MIIINGYVSSSDKFILDNGFNFGLGVFETILVQNKPLFLHEHLQRLNIGLKVLNLQKRIEEAYLLNILEVYKIKYCALKIIVTEMNIIISTRALSYTPEQYISGFKLKISNLKRNPYSHTVYIKSLNYTDNYLEKEKAKLDGYDEVLFTNIYEKIAEGSLSNIFFIKDKEIFTSSIDVGILDGIIRGWVINNFRVCQGHFVLEDIFNSDEVFLTNSIMGIMKVKSINGVAYNQCSIYDDIRGNYEKMIANNSEEPFYL